MALLLCNNVATTLSAAITTTGQTSISVTSVTGMPTPTAVDWFYLTLSDGAVNNPETAWEVVKVTGVSGTTLTVVRGQDNTTAATWANSSYIQARPCVQELRDAMALGLTRIAVADTAYTITATASVIIDYASLTAARVLNLPAATQAGQIVWVVDSSGAASSTKTITITRAGSDTIEGVNTTMVISAPYMAVCLVSNGAGKWATLAYEEVPLTLNDANLIITNREDVVVVITALTAARTITLPAAATTGQRVTVVDPLGLITTTHTVTVTRQGSDTINNALTTYVLAVAYASSVLVADGTTHWSCVQADQIASGASLSVTGAFPLTLATTAPTTATLPSGTVTLVALGGTNTWSAAQTWSVVSTFTQGFTLTAYAGGTTNGQFWYDSTQKNFAGYVNGYKAFSSNLLFAQTTIMSSTATTATSLINTTSAVGQLTFALSTFPAGALLRLNAKGKLVAAGTAGTMILTAGMGATTSSSATNTVTTASATYLWELELDFQVLASGSYSVAGSLKFYLAAAGTGGLSFSCPISATAVAITTNQNITATFTQSQAGTMSTNTCSLERLA